MVNPFFIYKEQCQQMEQPIKRKNVPIIGNEKTNTFTTSPYLFKYFIQYFTETIRLYSNLICFGCFLGRETMRAINRSGL